MALLRSSQAYDPFKNGRRIADLLLEFLATGEFPSDAKIAARYVPDETFPCR